MLEKNNQIRYITGYKFDINSGASTLCVDDKYATYEILKHHNIPVIEHKILYDETNNNKYAKGCNQRKIAYDYFHNHHNNIVIKGNNGTCGKEVYHITNESDIDKVLDILFQKNNSISLCPFYNILEEYRIIILNNTSKLIYSKKRPVVMGDGKSSISTLLKKFNPSYKYHLAVDRVLPAGEIYEYTWQHNLSSGSTINLDVSLSLKQKLSDMAIETAKSLNLNFGSIDIITTDDNKFLVLECNSGVMMHNLIKILPNGKLIAKDIYKEAIIKMFE